MSNYTVITDWDGKDALADSNPAKVISGDEFQDEFDAIATAISTKADINGSATETFSALSLTLGGTAVTSTATEINKLDGLTLALNLLNGMTGGVKDEDDMVSDSASALATQQSIKAYVDSQSSELYFGGGTATSGTDFSIQYGESGKCFVIGFGGRRATYSNFGSNTLQLRDGSTSQDSVTFRTMEYDSRLSSGSAVVMHNFTGGTAGATKTDVDLYWSTANGSQDYLKYFYVGY